METKQVIVVRKDLKLTKGKMSAQAAHAAVEAYRATAEKNPNLAKSWVNSGEKKVVVYAENLEELYMIKESVPDRIAAKVITDAGRTQLEPGTVTCMGIGPASEEDLNKVTGKLKLVD